MMRGPSSGCGSGADNESTSESAAHRNLLPVRHAQTQEEREWQNCGDNVEYRAEQGDIVYCLSLIETVIFNTRVSCCESCLVPVPFPVYVHRVTWKADGDDRRKEEDEIGEDGESESPDEARRDRTVGETAVESQNGDLD